MNRQINFGTSYSNILFLVWIKTMCEMVLFTHLFDTVVFTYFNKSHSREKIFSEFENTSLTCSKL